MSPPTDGSSTLITSAPRSARWTVPNGPAPYCSTATMRMPSSGFTGGSRATPARSRSAGVDRLLGLGEDVAQRGRAALVHVEGAAERADLLALLVERPRAHRDDPGVRARGGLALLQHHRLRAQGVA